MRNPRGRKPEFLYQHNLYVQISDVQTWDSGDGKITLHPQTIVASQPRALGRLRVSSKARDGKSVLNGLYQAGASRCLLPRGSDLTGVIINTAGGVTGGDIFETDVEAGADSMLTVTTQAAERAYRAAGSTPAKITNTVCVQSGGVIHWVPQELILFDGATYQRKLNVALETGASALIVEPIVFGRKTMAERLHTLNFADEISITRDGTPLFCGGMKLTGAVSDHLDRPEVANGAGALANVILVRDDAEAQLTPMRDLLAGVGFATLLRSDVLNLRLLASDSYELRRALVPALKELRGFDLPTSWRL